MSLILRKDISSLKILLKTLLYSSETKVFSPPLTHVVF
ncbi:hypothetical protein BREVNS_0221 [Brevinematales bacterium NS]|nr:hypothetical protein BREVNS_0221 [Brevinematales bacterium NS]